MKRAAMRNNKERAAKNAETNEDYKWRRDVRKRDGQKCKKCGESNKYKLQVHHIKPRSTHPTLVREISNGITLCRTCHKMMKGDESAWEGMCRVLTSDQKVNAIAFKLLRDLKNAEKTKDNTPEV